MFTMIIRQIRLLRIHLPLLTPYRLSYRTVEAFEPMLIEVCDGNGHSGWGEGHISPGSGNETPEQGWKFCSDAMAVAVGQDVATVKSSLTDALETNPVAASAMISALEMLGGDPLLQPPAEETRLSLLTPVNGLTPKEIEPEIENWNSEIRMFATSTIWVPHHILALVAGWTGLLLNARARSRETPQRLWLAVGAGAAYASMFGASVWISLTLAPVLIVWGMMALWRRDGTLLLSGVVALLLSVPQCLDLIHGRAPDVFPVALHIRPFTLLFAGHDLTAQLWSLILLPLNYALEFGFVMLGASLYARSARPTDAAGRPVRALLLGTMVAGLLVASFLQSVIINNDLGWRAALFILVPLMVWTMRVAQEDGAARRFGALGGLLLAVTLTLLVGALSMRDLFTASSFTPYLLFLAAAVAFLGLVRLQGRVTQPLLLPAFFRSRAAVSAVSAKLLMGAALLIALVTVPLMANTVLGQSPLEGGLRLMRLTGAVPVGALLGGYLTYSIGARVVTSVGLMIAAIGLFFMSGWDLGVSDPQFSLHLSMAGLGFGLVIVPLFVTAMDAGPDDYQATAASLVTVARMIGMALGLAALSAWGMDRFFTLTADLPPALSSGYEAELADTSITLFQEFFKVAMALSLVALVPVMAMARQSDSRQPSSNSLQIVVPRFCRLAIRG